MLTARCDTVSNPAFGCRCKSDCRVTVSTARYETVPNPAFGCRCFRVHHAPSFSYRPLIPDVLARFALFQVTLFPRGLLGAEKRVRERLLGRAGAPDGGSGEATRWREGLGELVPGVSFVN